jgi:hypothetical protein
MKFRSMKWTAGLSLVAAIAALGTALPERSATAQIQAVPRVGLSFTDTVTQRATIESIDTEDRTIAFTLSDGQTMVVPLGNNVGNLSAIADGSMANVTYSQVVTILNLRQKGPGSREARRDQMNPTPDRLDTEIGRFTVTVVAIDYSTNTVSFIAGNGGEVRTFKANTPAKQDLLKKMKVGDVVIGITTPLTVSAVRPAS